MGEPLFGRDALKGELLAALEVRAGLWTLSGAAGVGKSRLARALHDGWTAARHWVDLADVNDVAGLLEAVGLALRIFDADGDGTDFEARVRNALAAREGPLLLVLDDAEHVLDPLCRAVKRWLRAAPELRIVVTSREALALREERLVPVAPLDVEAGTALFEARARAVRGELSPSAEDREVYQEIVAQVDGLPLAIELAAARMRALDAPALRDRLHAPLDLLANGYRADKPRQRSLRSALDVSWERLEADGRAALVVLAALRGSFSLEEASALLGADALTPIDGLLGRSLLQRIDGGARYGMLSVVRAYARERSSAVDVEAALDRLAAWYAERVAAMERGALELARGSLELLAERGARGVGDPAHAARVGVALGHLDRPPHLHVAQLGALLERLPDDEPRLAAEARLARARKLLDLGELGRTLDDVAAARALTDDPACLAQGWLVESRAHYLGGRLEASTEAFETARRLDADSTPPARVMGLAGAIDHAKGASEAAERSARIALRLARASRDQAAEGLALSRLSFLACDRADYDEAEAAIRAALAIHRERGDRRNVARDLCYLGNLERARGHRLRAEEAYREALVILAEVGDRFWASVVEMDLGILQLRHGLAEQADATLRRAYEGARASEGARIQGLIAGYRAMASTELGDADEAAEQLALARTFLQEGDTLYGVLQLQEAFVRRAAPPDLREPPTTDHERTVVELLARRVGRDALQVRRDGRVYELPGEPARESGSDAAAAILVALMDARMHRAGDPCGVDDLFAHGWPGETAQRASRQNRVRVTIAKLRREGLREHLETVPGGYRLAPDRPATWSQAAPPTSAATSSKTDA